MKYIKTYEIFAPKIEKELMDELSRLNNIKKIYCGKSDIIYITTVDDVEYEVSKNKQQTGIQFWLLGVFDEYKTFSSYLKINSSVLWTTDQVIDYFKFITQKQLGIL